MSHESNLMVVTQQLTHPQSVMGPFALTDLLLHEAKTAKQAFLHFWETTPTVILGMKDTRVPQLAAGLAALKKAGYQSIARNSGGLAVISEPGILNFSLILPNPEAAPLSVTDGYQLMTRLIQETFATWTDRIIPMEIPTSYCPGDFDLSINGKKFAGISQRRIGTGLAVMIYLSIEGGQAQRGETIRSFYQKSLGSDFGQDGYPPVDPSAMANLTDLLHVDLTVADVKERISKQAAELFNKPIETVDLTTYLADEDRQSAFQNHLLKMKERNLAILPKGDDLSGSI